MLFLLPIYVGCYLYFYTFLSGCSELRKELDILPFIEQVSTDARAAFEALSQGWITVENARVEMITSRLAFGIESLHSEILLRSIVESSVHMGVNITMYALVGETDPPHLYQLTESSFLAYQSGPEYPGTYQLSVYTITIAYCMNGFKHSIAEACAKDFNSVPFYNKYRFGLQTRFKIHSHHTGGLSLTDQIHTWKNAIVNPEKDRMLGIQVSRTFVDILNQLDDPQQQRITLKKDFPVSIHVVHP
jgi:hypothetical protein